MTQTRLREVVLAAAVQASRISPSEAHFLKLYVNGELGHVGEDEHAEAERIVAKIKGQNVVAKEQSCSSK